MSRAWLLTLFLGVGCATPGGRALPPPASCDGGSQCGTACINLTTAADHCGTCDHKCNSGESCHSGKCVAGCVGNTKLCGADCVDTSNNPLYCGSCIIACDVGSSCLNGVCTVPCPSGETSCGADLGGCFNLQTSASHCGSCAVTCDQGNTCIAGNCRLTCIAPETACSNVYCANLVTDNNNCGACGNICAGGTVCVPSGGSAASTCKIPCVSGQTLCGTTCVNLQNDPSHCGGCGTMCNAMQTCVSGGCVNACNNSARSATATNSGGSAAPAYGPAAMNDGVGPSCSAYSWVTNGTSPGGKWIAYSWPSALQVGGLYIQTDSSGGSICSTAGRNLNGATVQWMNGSSWTTAGTISGQTGTTVRYDFPSPVTTNQIRLYDIFTSAGNGNTIIFEWYVYPVAGCTP